MEKEKIQMHKETCLICGYEGYNEDTAVIERGKCPNCGAKKLATYPEGEEPEAIIVIKNLLDHGRERGAIPSGGEISH